MKTIFALALTIMAASTSVKADSTWKETLTAVVFAPTISVELGTGCLFGDSTDMGISCMLLITVAPISSTTMLSLIALREEVVQVEQDAYDHLAGNPMSLALELLVSKVRNENEELKERPDHEVVIILLESLKA